MIRPFILAASAIAFIAVSTAADARGRRGRGGGGGPGAGSCNYCGCKGGPGYRGPNGNCVGKKVLHKVCGNPPSTRCKFEGRSGMVPETPIHPRITNPFAEG